MDRVKALELPEDVLNNCSDEELLYAVIHYPFIVDFLAFEDLKMGYDHLKNYSTVLEKYDKCDHKAAMLEEYWEKYISKGKEEGDLFRCYDECITQSLYYIETGIWLGSWSNAVRADGSDMYGSFNYVTLTTPNQSNVLCKHYLNDFSGTYISYWNSYYDSAYPNVTRIGPTTNQYNCHSYAWYWQSTLNPYWMESCMAYIGDGSYTETSIVAVGDIIYYNTGHSGVVALASGSMSNVRIRSKWAQYGLYYHLYDDCPYYPTTLHFYH